MEVNQDSKIAVFPLLEKVENKQKELFDAMVHGKGIGDFSDDYHTFNELYHHRAVLFATICKKNPMVSWKSKKHHDGSMFDGMFIVGVNTPTGQATYHYDIDPYWDKYFGDVTELEMAPEWDGHTPDQAIERIFTL